MKFPPYLAPGGTIGFVAPSFGCQTEPYRSGFENARRKFESMGYRLLLGPNCYAGEGVGISNTPEKCAAELTDYYCDKDCGCLISCGGGELMCEVLSHMDFERIRRAAPKWYMGYSDNTNFTYLLATVCDTASVYGPCAAAFGMEPWHASLNDAMGLLTGRQDTVRGYDGWERESLKDAAHPLAPYNVTEKRILQTFLGYDRTEGPVKMRGRLLGGCMDCLVNLLGTRFDRTGDFLERYRDDGIIWFLESCDLNVFGIRRAMWQMEEAGWFRYTKGFLFGRPLCGQEMMGLDACGAALEVAGRRNVPVVMNADLGHLPPMMPLITGSLAEIESTGDDISVTMHLW